MNKDFGPKESPVRVSEIERTKVKAGCSRSLANEQNQGSQLWTEVVKR